MHSSFIWKQIITVRNEVAKVMFLHLSVILFTGWGGLPQCMLGCHPPPGAGTPQDQAPPGSRHPPPPPEQRRLLLWTVRILLECILVTCLMFTARKRSLGQGNVFISVCDSVHRGGVSAPMHAEIHPPPLADTPNPLGYYGITSTSGRYASYCNAYLFILSFHSL